MPQPHPPVVKVDALHLRFGDSPPKKSPHPTSDFQVIDSLASGFGLQSHLGVMVCYEQRLAQNRLTLSVRAGLWGGLFEVHAGYLNHVCHLFPFY